jgi:hypothetical protein
MAGQQKLFSTDTFLYVRNTVRSDLAALPQRMGYLLEGDRRLPLISHISQVSLSFPQQLR